MSESHAPEGLRVLPVDGIGEVREGDDLAALVLRVADLRDGDILVVTSKVVSKAEGRVRATTREAALDGETDRVVARRGGTSIVRTRHGLVLAAGGVDASNTEPGTVVLLPLDADASARRLREAVAGSTGRNVGVVVTDTAGRAWRTGQTDLAVGAAGVEVVQEYAGQVDHQGNELAVTAPAVADELAAAADLVKRKLDRRPVAVVRGLDALVLPVGRHGPGAAALVRPEGQDMFGLGAREAVLAALRAEQSRGFGAPAPAAELADALARCGVAGVTGVEVVDAGQVRAALGGSDAQRWTAPGLLRIAAFAFGWHPAGPAQAGTSPDEVTFERGSWNPTPGPDGS
jgi:coenzyme F420-0:L-glutamate ligase / coenzyme F420-1:gamma-L-glutamate ligase